MGITVIEAHEIASRIIAALGQSDQIKTLGPNTMSGAKVEHQVDREELDAAYLAAL